MREVQVTEVPADAQLIDVREIEEYTAGHAACAINIPLSQFTDRLHEIDDSRDIYLICQSGGRSARVAQFLAARDLPAINVAGGTVAWHNANLPMA